MKATTAIYGRHTAWPVRVIEIDTPSEPETHQKHQALVWEDGADCASLIAMAVADTPYEAVDAARAQLKAAGLV